MKNLRRFHITLGAVAVALFSLGLTFIGWLCVFHPFWGAVVVGACALVLFLPWLIDSAVGACKRFVSGINEVEIQAQAARIETIFAMHPLRPDLQCVRLAFARVCTDEYACMYQGVPREECSYLYYLYMQGIDTPRGFDSLIEALRYYHDKRVKK